jgi:DNA-binding CsgD family transcriptional regulator
MFRWCSVFDGGWSIDELLMVSGRKPEDEPDVVAELASLVDQNLVVVNAQSNRPARYFLLKSMREFAADQLRRAGEDQQARNAHAGTFLSLSRVARSKMLFGGSAEHHEAVQWLDRERLNVRIAFDWFVRMGMAEQALETASSISPFNYLRGNLREDRDCLVTALSLPYDEPTEARAFATVRLSIVHWGVGDADSALALAREGYKLATHVGSKWVEGIALSCMAENHVMRGDYHEALVEGLKAIELFRAFGPVYELCWALNGCGFATGLIGHGALSERLLAEGNELCRATGQELFLAVSWCDQGILAYNRGDLPMAARLFARSVTSLHQLGDAWYFARSVIGMAGLLLDRGESAVAARLLGLAGTLSLRVGNSPHAVTSRQLDDISGRIRTLHSRKDLARLRGEGSTMPLAEAIRLIESYAGAPGDAPNLDERAEAPPLMLTSRQVEVLRLMVSKTDQEIARDLNISTRTVTTHARNIFTRMGVKSRTEAVSVAMSRGIIPNRVA